MAREMKNSDIEWIGEIPAEWNIRKGKWILKKLERQVEKSDGVITCFRDGEVTLRSNRREEGFTFSLQEDGYQGIESGDLVVHGMDGFAGAIGISDSRGKGSPVLNVMDSIQDKRYIMYYLRNMAYNGVFLALATGIRVRSCDTNWNKLKNLPYLVPALEEQKGVADYLDKKIAEIDAVIEKTKATIEEYRALKQSIITEAVTKGIRGDRPMKDSGIEWIGEISAEWSVSKIKIGVSKVGSGKTPLGGAESYAEEGVLFLRSQNVYDTGLFLDSPTYITEAVDEEMKNTRVYPRDVLLNITGGSIGRCCIFPNECIRANVNQHVSIIRVIESIFLPEYMHYYWLSSLGRTAIDLYQTGGNREGMSADAIKNSPIPVIPINEQKEIVEYLDKKCAEIDTLIAKKTALLEEMENYKKSVIYEYVTGKKEVI